MTAVTEILKAKGLSDVAVYAIAPTATVLEALQMMADKSVGAADVVLGLVSIGDLVKDIMSQQQFVIKQLEHYISGGHA